MAHTRLVHDALSNRRMTCRGCFVSNVASGELGAIGVEALPDIEAVILADVLPHYYCSSDTLRDQFPGLLSLLVAYFGIGRDSAEQRVSEFFKKLSGSVRVSAMHAIGTVWLTRRPTAPLPESILTTVRDLAQEGSGEIQTTALRLLE